MSEPLDDVGRQFRDRAIKKEVDFSQAPIALQFGVAFGLDAHGRSIAFRAQPRSRPSTPQTMRLLGARAAAKPTHHEIKDPYIRSSLAVAEEPVDGECAG